MREAGGAGAQEWKGGGTKHCEGQVVGGGALEGAGTRGNENVRRAAATDQALQRRDSQQAAAREARKHAGGMWMGAGQKRARKVQRGGKRELGCQRMGEWAVKVCSGR